MKKKIYISLIIISLIFIFMGVENQDKNEGLAFREYIDELKSEYNSNKDDILKKIDEELLNKETSKEDIGVNLLVKEYFYYSWGEYDRVMENLEETEKYLIRNKMDRELLFLYSIIFCRYTNVEDFNGAYIYIYKLEKTSKDIYNKEEKHEDLATLVSIQYLRALLALDIGMESDADEVFNEAEQLRKKIKGIERKDIYYYILHYYKYKNDYGQVDFYANKIEELREKENINDDVYEVYYIGVGITLANSYLRNGDIEKCIKIVEQLSKEELTFSTSAKRYEIYKTYAYIYMYYGNLEKYREYLEIAYNEVKDTSLNSRKIVVVKEIIDSFKESDNKEEVLKWYEIYIDITVELESLIDTQFFISQIIDNDLQNANYNIENLKIQRGVLKYIIMLLFIIIVITFMLILAENKRKKLLKENIGILEQQMIIQHNYYDSIKRYQGEMRRVIHDIKNHISVINKLINEKEYEHVKEYVEKIDKKIIENQPEIITNNKIINAILFNKSEICKDKNIKLDVDVKLPDKINIDDFDICVLYGNLLDNAIEACENIDRNSENRYIKIRSIIKGDYLFINIKNSNNKEVYVKGNKFLTSKKDKVNHGIGIISIKRTIEKYDGDIKINYSDKYFNVSIMIKI